MQNSLMIFKLAEMYHAFITEFMFCVEFASCRLAYGPADATATHCLLL